MKERASLLVTLPGCWRYSLPQRRRPQMEGYVGQQYVGIDLHVRREGARVQWAAVREVRLMP